MKKILFSLFIGFGLMAMTGSAKAQILITVTSVPQNSAVTNAQSGQQGTPDPCQSSNPPTSCYVCAGPNVGVSGGPILPSPQGIITGFMDAVTFQFLGEVLAGLFVL